MSFSNTVDLSSIPVITNNPFWSEEYEKTPVNSFPCAAYSSLAQFKPHGIFNPPRYQPPSALLKGPMLTPLPSPTLCPMPSLSLSPIPSDENNPMNSLSDELTSISVNRPAVIRPPFFEKIPKLSTLIIRNIPRDITEEYIRYVFQPYGQVLHVSIPRNQDKISKQYGTNKGYAFVKMYNYDQAVHALNGLHNKLVIRNRYISIEFAKHSKK